MINKIDHSKEHTEEVKKHDKHYECFFNFDKTVILEDWE